jgi:tripartite-type tricarboxylate transporter receptor subunit TctC
MTLISKFCTTLFAAFCVVSAHADTYPSKPIKIIVPAAAGGGTDTLARLLGNSMRAQMNATVLVENKPGATQNIGMEFVAKSPADGYTLIVVPDSIGINQGVSPQSQFHAVNSFSPIALIGSSPVVLVGRPGAPFKNMRELVAHAKANPNKLSYGSCGIGTIHHMAGELIKANSGVALLHVPYKGCSQSNADLLGGQIDLAIISINNVAANIESGKLVAYAVTSEKRALRWPNIPTMLESGIPNLNLPSWYGILAPAGTPKDIIEKLNKVVNQALKEPQITEAFKTIHMEPIGGTPEQFTEVLKADVDRFTKLAKSANIQF